MYHKSIALSHVTVRHQRKDVVEMGAHVAGVKVHDGRPVGLRWVCVVVHEDNHHDVIANVTLTLELQDKKGSIYMMCNYIEIHDVVVVQGP